MEIYLLIDGAAAGPYSVDSIREKLDKAEINSESLAWHAELSDWTPIEKIPEFSNSAECIAGVFKSAQDAKSESKHTTSFGESLLSLGKRSEIRNLPH